MSRQPAQPFPRPYACQLCHAKLRPDGLELLDVDVVRRRGLGLSGDTIDSAVHPHSWLGEMYRPVLGVVDIAFGEDIAR
jgi:hypothetical protein